MPAKKISELTAAAALVGDEIVPVVQGGQTVRSTSQALADLGAGGVSAIDVIATATLAADASSIAFPDIPQTYSHLRLMIMARTTEAAANGSLFIRFNGDATAAYDSQRIFNNAATPSGGQFAGETFGRIGVVPGANGDVGHAAAVTVEIPDYSRTAWEKAFLAQSFHTHADATGSFFQQYAGGRWRSTAAITAITLLPGAQNIATGTVATLYGLKG